MILVELKEKPSAPPPELKGSSYPKANLAALSQTQRNAIWSYTGNGYEQINHSLRGKTLPTPHTLKQSNAMQNVMLSNSWDPPKRVLRGSGINGLSAHLGLPEANPGTSLPPCRSSRMKALRSR